MNKSFNSLIKEYEYITIFRHKRPDGDAMFSSLALYTFLKDNFKEKKVKIGGFDDYDIITKKDKLSDTFIRKSLAIVLDTANTARVDDERFKNAAYIVKIDHHPTGDEYGDLNIVDPHASATCQILSEIFFSKAFSAYEISQKTCTYLYCGLITDTINFRTTNVTYKTLESAYKLVKKGNLKVSDLVEYLMDKDIKTYLKASKIRSLLKIKDNFGYVVLDQKDLNKMNMSVREAKDNIDEIGTISDLKVWALACQEEDGTYSVSLRSKRGYIINNIADQFGGGGHANASGVKGINKTQLNALFKQLVELSTIKQKALKKA